MRNIGGYSAFVDRIRENENTMPREEAMKAAIKHGKLAAAAFYHCLHATLPETWR